MKELNQSIDQLTEQGNRALTGADLVPLLLKAQGIKKVPCLQGGQIMPTMDSASRVYGNDQIFFRTEYGLAFAVMGMSKTSGIPHVGIVTSGPGGLNTLTQLADATRDCVPMGIITGQVPHSAMGTDAFQGIDIVKVADPLTKSARLIESIDDFLRRMPRDLGLACSGKPGSVLWDLPKDVQLASLDVSLIRNGIEHYSFHVTKPELDTDALDRAIKTLYQSKRPVFLAGYGLGLANVSTEFHTLLELTKIPVAHTLPGKGAVNSSYQYNLGMLGMHGLVPASAAAHHADCIFALGSRYDDRAVCLPREFAPSAQERKALIHVDIEANQFAKARELAESKQEVLGDAGDVVRYLLKHIDPSKIRIDPWRETIREWQAKNPPPPSVYADHKELDMMYLLEKVNLLAQEFPNYIAVTDIGNHQMWAAQRLKMNGHNSFLTSAGLGTMGSGITQGIGAALVAPERMTIVIEGDESSYFCMQELRTAAEYKIPVKVLLINNGGQGIVRQWAGHIFGREVGVHDPLHDHIPETDYVGCAKSYGVPAERISEKNQLGNALRRMVDHNGPYLVECKMPWENCLPWIRPGTGFPEIITKL